MSSADSSIGVRSENRNLLGTVAAAAVIFLVLLGLLGFGGAVGVLGFAVYVAVWLAVGLFVLWLLYRLVVAVERIAHAQQRIAVVQNPPGGSATTTADDGDGRDAGSGSDADDAP